jgi:hypothetical protein
MTPGSRRPHRQAGGSGPDPNAQRLALTALAGHRPRTAQQKNAVTAAKDALDTHIHHLRRDRDGEDRGRHRRQTDHPAGTRVGSSGGQAARWDSDGWPRQPMGGLTDGSPVGVAGSAVAAARTATPGKRRMPAEALAVLKLRLQEDRFFRRNQLRDLLDRPGQIGRRSNAPRRGSRFKRS